MLKMQQIATQSHSLIPIGRASAGPALETFGSCDLMDLSAFVTGGRPGFVLAEVDGTSMLRSIPHGCLIVINTNLEPRSGHIIAGSINGAICVKKFKVNGRHLSLVSTNGHYKDRPITEDDNFVVIGVVTKALIDPYE